MYALVCTKKEFVGRMSSKQDMEKAIPIEHVCNPHNSLHLIVAVMIFLILNFIGKLIHSPHNLRAV